MDVKLSYSKFIQIAKTQSDDNDAMAFLKTRDLKLDRMIKLHIMTLCVGVSNTIKKNLFGLIETYAIQKFDIYTASQIMKELKNGKIDDWLSDIINDAQFKKRVLRILF